MVSLCVSTLPGAALVCAKQQQFVLPGYGSEHRLGRVPGQWVGYSHPCFKGDKKPVLDYFSVVANAQLSPAFAKRCGFFWHPSVCLCLSHWHELPRSAAAVCAVTSQLYPAGTSLHLIWRPIRIFILRLQKIVLAVSHQFLLDRWDFRPVFHV